MFIPTKENYTDMTPSEFEQYALSQLEQQFHNRKVDSYSFEHNIKTNAHDGTYQIDGVIKLSTMGIELIILVECKHYKGPIKREQIQALNDKIHSIGAHKGVFITTSYYQSGAVTYAKEHGIALISIVDGKMQYEARSREWNGEIPSWVSVKPYVSALQTQTTSSSISVTIIDETDALYRFVVDDNGGDSL